MDAVELAGREDDHHVAGLDALGDVVDDRRHLRDHPRRRAAAAQIGGELLGVEAVLGGDALGVPELGDDDLVGVGEGVGELALEGGAARGRRARLVDRDELAAADAAPQRAERARTAVGWCA